MKHSNKSAIDNFLSVFKIVNEALDLSKTKIEEIIYNNCIDESLKLFEKIQLPNYSLAKKSVDSTVPGRIHILMTINELFCQGI